MGNPINLISKGLENYLKLNEEYPEMLNDPNKLDKQEYIEEQIEKDEDEDGLKKNLHDSFISLNNHQLV